MASPICIEGAVIRLHEISGVTVSAGPAMALRYMPSDSRREPSDENLWLSFSRHLVTL